MNDPLSDPQLEPYFKLLCTTPTRDPEKAAEGKAAFLDRARTLSDGVSKMRVSRLNQRQIVGKERNAMLRIAGTILIVLATVFGGGGVTVAAAQSSMPDDTLYPVKLWSEDAALWITAYPQAKIDLALQYADRRLEEIVHQVESSLSVEDSLLLRLIEQDDLALSLAAEVEAPTALEKVRERLEIHERVLAYIDQGRGPVDQALLLQTREMVRQRLELLQGDLLDLEVRARIREEIRNQHGMETPIPAGGQGDGQMETTPGGQGNGEPGLPGGGGQEPQQSNPWTETTPTPGSGYGPGPGPDVTGARTPQSGKGKNGNP